MTLILPVHVARTKAIQQHRKNEAPPVAFEDLERNKALIQALAEAEGKDVVQDVDTPIPEGLPYPGQWRVTLMPVRQIARTKSGLQMVAEFLDVQHWTHQLWKVCRVGNLVYRGPAYQGFTELELDREKPKVGELYLVDPKAPRRFKYHGITYIVVNDDQLWSRVDPTKIDGLEFKNGAL